MQANHRQLLLLQRLAGLADVAGEAAGEPFQVSWLPAGLLSTQTATRTGAVAVLSVVPTAHSTAGAARRRARPRRGRGGRRLEPGTAVTNLVTRHPAVVAATFATLHSVTGGRALPSVRRAPATVGARVRASGQPAAELPARLHGGRRRSRQPDPVAAGRRRGDGPRRRVRFRSAGHRGRGPAGRPGHRHRGGGTGPGRVGGAHGPRGARGRGAGPADPRHRDVRRGGRRDGPARARRARARRCQHLRPLPARLALVPDVGDDAAVVADVSAHYDDYHHGLEHAAQAQALSGDFLRRSASSAARTSACSGCAG